MTLIEPDKFRLDSSVDRRKPSDKKGRLPEPKPGEEFLAGPIPLTWLTKAACLPGKTLTVSLVIWFKARCNKMNTMRMSNTLLAKFGVNRKAGYEALRRLEKAGLIKVEHHSGRSPIVTVLDCERYLR